MLDKNPWLSIWCEPRATIRRIVEQNPNRSLWILAFIYGFLSLLNSFQSISIGSVMGMASVFLIAVVLSPLWGYAGFSIWSWVVCKVGRLLKGEGSFSHVRAAFAWSCVPLTVNIFLWLIMIFSFGFSFFFHPQETMAFSSQQSAFLLLILIGKVGIAIWSLVIYLNALAEVQKFSILRAIFNVILSWIAIGLVLAGLWYVLMYLLQMNQSSSNLTLELWQSGTTLEFLRAIL